MNKGWLILLFMQFCSVHIILGQVYGHTKVSDLDTTVFEYETHPLKDLVAYLKVEYLPDSINEIKIMVDTIDYEGYDKLYLQFGAFILLVSINEGQDISNEILIRAIYLGFAHHDCPMENERHLNHGVEGNSTCKHVNILNPRRRIYSNLMVQYPFYTPPYQTPQCPEDCYLVDYRYQDGKKVSLMWHDALKSGNYELYIYDLEHHTIENYLPSK